MNTFRGHSYTLLGVLLDKILYLAGDPSLDIVFLRFSPKTVQKSDHVERITHSVRRSTDGSLLVPSPGVIPLPLPLLCGFKSSEKAYLDSVVLVRPFFVSCLVILEKSEISIMIEDLINPLESPALVLSSST